MYGRIVYDIKLDKQKHTELGLLLEESEYYAIMK